MTVANKAAFFKALDQYEQKVVRLFRSRVKRVVSEALTRCLAKTPVHTGSTVASYVVQEGIASAGTVHSGWTPVERTNQLPLGSERLRERAEAVALQSLANVNFEDPFKVFTISNAAPQAALLEIGAAPTPETTRVPMGMFRVTNQELLNLLQSGKI